MKAQFQRCSRRVIILFVPILIGLACALEPIFPNSGPPNPQSRADLTALNVIVKRLRGDTSLELGLGDKVEIETNDRVSVDEAGRGLLRFENIFQVEVFRATDVQLSEAQLDPGGSIFIRLKQISGHTRAELNEEVEGRIKLETDYAVITPLNDETEFLVCHAVELTCMVTLAGETQVEAENEAITVRAGEATYIFPDQPPQPPICANVEQVRQWLEQKRGTVEIDPLGALVIGWPQEPCSTPPTPPPAMPSAESMASIEAGSYQVGRSTPDDNHVALRDITLPQFWIDQFEVTNAAYAKFLDETGHPPPTIWPGPESQPVKGVTWDDAVAYCRWVNKRLPSEAEWEVAARGPGPAPPLYPWGSDPRAGGLTDGLPLTETYPVGSQPFNKSPFEVYDMAGNVWEWVDQPYDFVPDGQRLLRGGRHGLLKDMAYRQAAEPADTRFVGVAGFRCAADQVEGG